ncbi:hypothetical protein Poli38472_013266 [Pythium oligandrum]|uniref:Uncharacterized protein n=1 Tax=Pythium oligandrum TaxID=41045 RepID=A0A8K1C2Q7_PYTOL|nr:hypothetical protein Poli38472_013266 [Pythium oligandrum]|eukprot:TMW55375.1 hypothetical protein Poli38472_013266 [Pythium oligandrum]
MTGSKGNAVKGQVEKLPKKRSTRWNGKKQQGANTMFIMESSMEASIRKIKLERRALQRKHDANDLVGSTRLEYQAELAKIESLLDKQAAQLRKRNPTLYDELNAKIKIKAATGVPRSERDSMQGANGAKKRKLDKLKEKKAAEKRKRQLAGSRGKTRATDGLDATANETSPTRTCTIDADVDEANREPSNKKKRTPKKPPLDLSEFIDTSKRKDDIPPRVIMTRGKQREIQPAEIVLISDDD